MLKEQIKKEKIKKVKLFSEENVELKKMKKLLLNQYQKVNIIKILIIKRLYQKDFLMTKLKKLKNYLVQILSVNIQKRE